MSALALATGGAPSWIQNWDLDQTHLERYGCLYEPNHLPSPRSASMSTQSTISRHLSAIPQGIDTIIADYANDAVLITQDAVFRGPVEIRRFFEAFMANASPELLAAFAVTRLETHGEIGYLLWKADPFIPFATDTFVVRDDRIVAQTFAMVVPATANA